MGIVQGGDPLSTDPAKAKLYGTGGLGMLEAEVSSEPHTRGAVSAVLQPGKPDSGGAQFFVCVTDQPALTGKYTVFGRVSEGMAVLEKISETPATADGKATERVEIRSVEIRDTPPPVPEPFRRSPSRSCAVPPRARDQRRTDHDQAAARKRARDRAGVPAAGGRRGVQRHRLPPCRPRLRGPDRLPRFAWAARRDAAEDRASAGAGVQRHGAREGRAVDGASATIGAAPRRPSSS